MGQIKRSCTKCWLLISYLPIMSRKLCLLATANRKSSNAARAWWSIMKHSNIRTAIHINIPTTSSRWETYVLCEDSAKAEILNHNSCRCNDLWGNRSCFSSVNHFSKVFDICNSCKFYSQTTRNTHKSTEQLSYSQFLVGLLDSAYFKQYSVSPCTKRFGILSVITNYKLLLHAVQDFSLISPISLWHLVEPLADTKTGGKPRPKWHLPPLSTLCNYKASREKVISPIEVSRMFLCSKCSHTQGKGNFSEGFPLAKREAGNGVAKYSGWWFEPLWKILVNWDDYSQYMGK